MATLAGAFSIEGMIPHRSTTIPKLRRVVVGTVCLVMFGRLSVRQVFSFFS